MNDPLRFLLPVFPAVCLFASLPAQRAHFVPIPGISTTPATNPSFCGLSGSAGYSGVRVSADGHTIATVVYPPGAVTGAVPIRAARWRATTGSVVISPLLTGNYGVVGVSADGSTIYGESWRWREQGGYVSLLPQLGNGLFQTRLLFGCSDDGSTAVGIDGIYPSPADMFTWQVGQADPRPVPRVAAYPDGYAYFNTISGDGRVVAGSVRRLFPGQPGVSANAAVVVGPGGPTVITGESGQEGVTDLSADGTVAVGYSETAPGPVGLRAFRWDAVGGLVVLDTLVAASDFSYARATDAAGAVVVGDYGTFGTPGSRAFLWSAARGFVDLQDELVNLYGMGPQLAGWRLLTAIDVSADGRTIVGQAVNPAGCEQAFLIRLPRVAGRAVAYGPSCVAPTGTLELAAVEPPLVGVVQASTCTGVSAGTASHFALIGFDRLALPLQSVLPQGQSGCELLVSPDFALPVNVGAQGLIVSFPIPNDAALVRATYRQQVLRLETDPAGRLLALQSSNGVELTIGTL